MYHTLMPVGWQSQLKLQVGESLGWLLRSGGFICGEGDKLETEGSYLAVG